jgi:glycosyltransferase involved in cell wall biosynthesis
LIFRTELVSLAEICDAPSTPKSPSSMMPAQRTEKPVDGPIHQEEPLQGEKVPATQKQHSQQNSNQPSNQQRNSNQQPEPVRGQGQERRREPNRQRGPRSPQHNQGIDISVVIPLYNEEDSLRELHQELRSTFKQMNVRNELLFIDDGSTDSSYQRLRGLKHQDHRVKIVRFRRNYGKSAALSVGFEKAQGKVVITMDADLQDDPSEIPALVKRINEGFDLVSGWKKVRQDPIAKIIPSRFFNFVTSFLTGIKIHDFNCGLKAYRKEVVKTVKVYGELHRYVPVLAHWEGFKVGEMPVHHRPRKYGKTKFGMGRFWKGFLDLLTALFTTRYFRRPLHLFGFWGVLAFLAGLAIDSWLVVEWSLGMTALGNRPLFLGGILLIIVGIQIVSIGLLGEMISKTRHAEEQYAIREFIR